MRPESVDSLVHHWGEYRRPQRWRPWRRRFWLLPAVLALAVFVGIAVRAAGRSHGWRPPSGAPHFVSCSYGGRLVGWCARLRVAEDPQRSDGRTISLRITVLPATKRPAAGALFYLEGGPGGAATASAIRVDTLFAEVQRNRDLVMVDQRGTGGSNRLSCPGGYVDHSDPRAVTAYLRLCLERLRANPRLYTTSVAADDLETVRRTLGYGRIDLYGGSYGATLAQAYVRRYPGSVRTLVLDSGSLPNVRVYDVSPRSAEQALETLFQRCAAAAACKRAYPDPRQRLAELLARPPRMIALPRGEARLGPDDIAWTVDWLSETTEDAATIPYALDAAADGDYTALATTYVADLGGPDLEPIARLVPFWVILCSEPWATFDPVETAHNGRGSYLAAAAVARARLFRRACSVVPKGRVPRDAAARRLVRAPALLLAGGADPLDPVANLRGWRRVFPRGRLVVVPGAGHGTLEYPCVQTLIARFVDRGGGHGLDASCLRHIGLPPFMTG